MEKKEENNTTELGRPESNMGMSEEENTPELGRPESNMGMSEEEKILIQSILHDSLSSSVRPEEVIPQTIQFIERAVMPPLEVVLKATEDYVEFTNVGVCSLPSDLHSETPPEFVEGFKCIVKEMVSHNMAILNTLKLFIQLLTEVLSNLKSGRGFKSLLFVFVFCNVLATSFAHTVAQPKPTCYTFTPQDKAMPYLDLGLAKANEACREANTYKVTVKYRRQAFAYRKPVLKSNNSIVDQKVQFWQDNFFENMFSAITEKDTGFVKEKMQERANALNKVNRGVSEKVKKFKPEVQRIGSLVKKYKLFLSGNSTGEEIQGNLLECVKNPKSLSQAVKREQFKKKFNERRQLALAHDQGSAPATTGNDQGSAPATTDSGNSDETSEQCQMGYEETNEIFLQAFDEMFLLDIQVKDCYIDDDDIECVYVIKGGMMDTNNIIYMLNAFIKHLSISSEISNLDEMKANPALLFAILAKYAEEKKETFYQKEMFSIPGPIWMVDMMDKLGEIVISLNGMNTFIRTVAESNLDFLVNSDFLTFYIDHFQNVNIYPHLIHAATDPSVSFPAALSSLYNNQKRIAVINRAHSGPSATEKIQGAWSLIKDTQIAEKLGNISLAAVNVILDTSLKLIEESNKTLIETLEIAGTEVRKTVTDAALAKNIVTDTGLQGIKDVSEAVGTLGKKGNEVIVEAGKPIIYLVGAVFLLASLGGCIACGVRKTNNVRLEILKGNWEYENTRRRLEHEKYTPPGAGAGDIGPPPPGAGVEVAGPPPPGAGNNAPQPVNYRGFAQGTSLYEYLRANGQGTEHTLTMYNGATPTELKIYNGKVSGLKDKVVKRKGNGPQFETVNELQDYTSISRGGGTRKHKKRIGAASKHHKKRRRGTKKPSKKRRATRRKRR